MLKVLASFTGDEITMKFIDAVPSKREASLAFSDTGKRFEVYAAKFCNCKALRRTTLVYRVALLAQDMGIPQDSIVNHTIRASRPAKIDPNQGKLL